MIQLANDPNASRANYRPTEGEAKALAVSSQRGRSGHAWPFLSRHAGRPVQQQDSQKPTANDSGS
jgi:hypothetical protein